MHKDLIFSYKRYFHPPYKYVDILYLIYLHRTWMKRFLAEPDLFVSYLWVFFVVLFRMFAWDLAKINIWRLPLARIKGKLW